MTEHYCEEFVAEWLFWICPMLSSFAYPAVFVINLIGSASIFLPIPGFLAVFFLGALGSNPWLLGISAGLGATIGELTGYALGFGGKKIIEKKAIVFYKKSALYRYWNAVGKKYFAFVVFVFAATPLPDDLVGIIGGASKYDLKKFFVACFLGKFVLFSALAWAGFFGMDWLLTAFS